MVLSLRDVGNEGHVGATLAVAHLESRHGFVCFVREYVSILERARRARRDATRASPTSSAGAATTNAMEETVSSIDAVQSLGGMRAEAEKFNLRSLESYFRERVALVVGRLLFVTAGIAVLAIAVYVFTIVTDAIFEGTMSPGDFGVLFGMFFGIVGGAIEIGVFWLNLQNEVPPARRIFFFIDYESDDDQTTGRDLTSITDGVRIEHVDYAYPDGTTALRDVSLEMRLGEMSTASVGTSPTCSRSTCCLPRAFATTCSWPMPTRPTARSMLPSRLPSAWSSSTRYRRASTPCSAVPATPCPSASNSACASPAGSCAMRGY